MGRASRWLRGLLGGKRAAPPPALPPDDHLPSSKEKQRWGFVKSFREKAPPQAAAAALPEERKRSYKAPARSVEVVDDEEQSKRAIAVAAATAAVAEAAVAAAQAAAAVVRLTSGGRSVVGGAKREEWAAVKIQSSFRGYLARRALRALKGLVKLQALVRGNIVRKQAAETLRCMQALVRVQARARACRAIRSERSKASREHPEKSEPAIRPNVSRTLKRNSSNQASNAALSSIGTQRNPSNQASNDAVHSERTHSSGWNWLDRWMEERYWDTREAARRAGISPAMEDERNAKILEIDTGEKPQRRVNSSNHIQSSCSTLTSDHNSLAFAATAAPGSPSLDSSSTVQQSAPSPTSVRRCLSPLRFAEAAREFTDSPQFFSATSSRPGSSRRGPFTPAKSECSRSLFSGYSGYPNYMSNTHSSKAKVRSQSAPKQRAELEKTGSFKRASSPVRKESSGTAAQRSSSSAAQLRAKFANKAYPGSGRLDKLGMPLRY